MNKENELFPSLLVVFRAVMWGIIGVFGRNLSALGFNAIQVATMRCLVNSVLMFILIFTTDKNKLSIDVKDSLWFVANGLFSIYIFSIAYQKCITVTNISTAVVLLYTAPVFVAVMSVIFFHEKLSKLRIFSLVMCIVGSRLVCGIASGIVINGQGLMYGLLSGFGYALYSIFSTVILRKYHAFTNIFYTFLVAGIAGLLTCQPVEMFAMMSHSATLTAWAVGNGIVTSFLAYTAYTTALSKMKRSKASVIRALEPVVATAVGIVIYHEKMSASGFAGILMVIVAIILQNINTDKKEV